MGDRALRSHLLGVLLLLAPLAIAVRSVDRFTLHLLLNRFHGPVTDTLLKNATHLADAVVPVLLSVLLLAHSWRAFLSMALSTGLSALVVQWLKHVVVVDRPRPSQYLQAMPDLPLVGGVELLQGHSFPSGHTAAAFSMALVLAVLSGRRVPAFMLVLLAGLVGFSRIHLSQHFPGDVLAGALIGTGTALGVVWWLRCGPFSGAPWLERSPMRRVQRNQ